MQNSKNTKQEDKTTKEKSKPSCAICGDVATKRLTPDLDIHGIPMCDKKTCKDQIHLKLWMAMEGTAF